MAPLKKKVPGALVHMADVGDKTITRREAVARGKVIMARSTLKLIKDGALPKGDVLGAARLSGIMAAKETSRLLPLCHPLPIEHVAVELSLDRRLPGVLIEASARVTARTGVEMEALTAVSIAALSVYDMCKPVDKGLRITDIRLVRKSGGKSGTVVFEE
jgi:cyclic pyranopterin phosphate synthase